MGNIIKIYVDYNLMWLGASTMLAVKKSTLIAEVVGYAILVSKLLMSKS